MSTSLQIKQIHTLKNILGLDDDLYREMLASFGVYSSKKLTETEANILIEILQDKTKKLKLNFQFWRSHNFLQNIFLKKLISRKSTKRYS